MDTLTNLMIGIIAGVISSIIIWIIAVIIKTLLYPKIKELLYSGIDLEGEWQSDYFFEKEIEETGRKKKVKVKIKEIYISITQSAYSLTGDMMIKNIAASDESITYYKFTGVIKDNYLILNYMPKSKRCLGLGSLVLTVKNGGSSLVGSLTGTVIQDLSIGSLPNIDFVRK